MDCLCVRTLAGGRPQSNVAGAREGGLSISGFFDQADFAWCFALRFPPLALNGEGEVVGGKVTDSGGRGVVGVPSVESRRPPPSFWGVLNSVLVLLAVEAFVLSSGLSRTPNRTFFNLYADRSAFKVVAAAAAVEDVTFTGFPPLFDLSGNRLSRAEEDLDFWKDLRSSLDMREERVSISSIRRAIAISMLRYVRLMVSKVGALEVTMRTEIQVDPSSFNSLETNFSRFFPLQLLFGDLQVTLQLIYPVTDVLQDMRCMNRCNTQAPTRTCFLSLACFSKCSGPRFRVFNILAKSGLLKVLLNLAISSFLVHAIQTVNNSF